VYSTYENQAEDLFYGVKATNLYRNTAAREWIEKYLAVISRFNIYLKIVVRKKYSSRL
jgi:hypothetical protein